MINMNRLELLKQATTKPELASILGVNPSFFTRTLYVVPVESQYYQFQIPKRSGGQRTINAPTSELKDIQSRLSELLLDCIDEINTSKDIVPKLSHGFTRNRSIITNAEKHTNQKNVLNIDLSDFFDSFNFGRVRGFFLKNNNFNLHNNIATAIAKIACLNNMLPQGSPCSPVITNLITHSLDIRLAALAKRNSCIYSRYADDITISTRNHTFKNGLLRIDGTDIVVGNILRREIERAGFAINEKKTRVQYCDSRQDVTGLIVNKKVNIKKEYWKNTRAMCHKLFTTGSYIKLTAFGEVEGTIDELEGRLNFIDSVDRYHHVRPKGPIDYRYQSKNAGLNYRAKLNVRERMFSKYLYYRSFYANEKPTIIVEGKTDIIYLRSAIKMLSNNYNSLAYKQTGTSTCEMLINFFKYSPRTKYLLDLEGGGTCLKKFVERYRDNLKYYQKTPPINPVILLLDNDGGPNQLLGHLVNQNKNYPNCPNGKDDIRNTEFVHITSNLYIILTPRINDKHSKMEDFFDEATHEIIVGGRTFDASNDYDTTTSYGKNTFATDVVEKNKGEISFEGFKPILERISSVLQHYKNLEFT